MELTLSWNDTHIDEFLEHTVMAGYDTLHLDTGRPPRMQRRGDDHIVEMPGYGPGRPMDVVQMIYGILTDDQIRAYERESYLQFEYAVKRAGKFACIIVQREKLVAGSFCLVPVK